MRLDSFLKETQRVNPMMWGKHLSAYHSCNPSRAVFADPSAITVNLVRKVLKPISLSDGTSVNAGTMLAVPTDVLDREESRWSDLDDFQGFRYYNLRQSTARESNRHRFSESSSEAMFFGYGVQACPGRFSASVELKILMAHLIMNFDMRLKDKEKGRPANSEFHDRLFPDTTDEVIF